MAKPKQKIAVRKKTEIVSIEDKYGRDGRDPDDPIFDYDDEDLEGSRFDPDCEDDPM